MIVWQHNRFKVNTMESTKSLLIEYFTLCWLDRGNLGGELRKPHLMSSFLLQTVTTLQHNNILLFLLKFCQYRILFSL